MGFPRFIRVQGQNQNFGVCIGAGTFMETSTGSLTSQGSAWNLTTSQALAASRGIKSCLNLDIQISFWVVP